MEAAAILEAQRRTRARFLSIGDSGTGKKVKLGLEHGGQRKGVGGGGGEGRQRRWVREEHLTQEMNRCAAAEEVAERGWSKNSKQ